MNPLAPPPPPPDASDENVTGQVVTGKDGKPYELRTSTGADGQVVTYQRRVRGTGHAAGQTARTHDDRRYLVDGDGSFRRLDQKSSKKEKRALRRARRR